MIRLISLCIITFIVQVNAQDRGILVGKITSGEKQVEFVNIGLEGTTLGAASDIDGKYELKNIPYGSYSLKITAIGYKPKNQKITIDKPNNIVDIELEKSAIALDQVVVTGNMKEVFISESPVKIEIITAAFLKTNPTNNVIEALQTVNGVQEQINCGVCGTNDIHINGMEGPYTLVLIDGMPIMSALASVYGFNGIPTSLIERIEIIKGPSSTLYGTEAVGGVINIITKDPANLPLATFNSFYTAHQELNLDLAITPEISDKLTTTISGNYYRNQYRLDKNEDNFTDIPLNNRLSLFNKWTLKRNQNRITNLAVRYYTEDRFGGVLQWEKEDRGSDSIYGESIYTNRIEVIGSYQLPFSEMIRVDYSFNNHRQDSYYGNTYYKADQSVYFANFLWNKQLEKHDFLLGLTTRYQTYTDNSFANTSDKRFIPGVFIQNEYALTERTKLLGGMRFDYHKDHGVVFSPRLNVKRELSDFTTFRANFGTGFRLVNLFTEDHAALTGARQVLIAEELQPEESYNLTLSLNHLYILGNSNGSLNADMFYTYFSNKIIPDYETDENLIIYDNLNGYGITRGFSVSIEHQFDFPVVARLGATIQDVYEIDKDKEGNKIKERQVFAPIFSGTFSISYKVKKWNTSLDYTGRIVGPQKLPAYEPPFDRPEQSPWYSVQNLQITKTFNEAIEVYGGVKNLLNYTQPSPLINPQNPFSDSFDTAYAYGPLQTRRIYIGLRLSIFKRNNI